LLRYRYVVAAVPAGFLGYVCQTLPTDLYDFSELGRKLIEGDLAAVYESSWNQAGPAQLLISRLLLIGGRDGMPSSLLMALVNIGLALGAMALCARLSGDRGPALARREAVVGLLTVVWLTVPLPWESHPAELAIPLCWAYAISAQKRGRWWLAAAVLAMAAAIAPWGVLGFPCLLAAGLRRAYRTGLLAAALSVGCYLPFVLTGHFAMFHLRWTISDGALIHLLAPGLAEFTWPIRLLQGAIVAAGCGLTAWRCRDDPLVIALAPLVAALLRVATDPMDFSYYWFPVAVATVLTLAVMPATEPRYRQVLAVVLGYLALLAEATRWTVPGIVACLVVLLLLLSPTARRKRPDHRLGDRRISTLGAHSQ
jgi:hypothetical protein